MLDLILKSIYAETINSDSYNILDFDFIIRCMILELINFLIVLSPSNQWDVNRYYFPLYDCFVTEELLEKYHCHGFVPSHLLVGIISPSIFLW